MRASLFAILLVTLLAACGSDDQTPGLRQPPPFPGSAAVTEWTVQGELPEGYGADSEGFTSAEAMVDALLTQFRAQTGDLRVELRSYFLGQDGHGGAIAVFYGLRADDDSDAGDELEISMRPSDDGRWRITGLRHRRHCLRATAEDSCI